MSTPQQEVSPHVKARLVEHGAFLLKTFHDEFAKDKTNRKTEFWRGNLAGWRHTLVSIYGERITEEIIDGARKKTNLPIPHSGPLTDDGAGYFGFDSGADF